jgi:integrase
VLEYAHAKNWRTASFAMDAVNRSLPKQTKRHGRFAAVPVKEVQSFMALLRERDTVSRVALEACILTATRSGEIRGAVWSEIDVEKKIWTIPAKRMKAGKKHTVALSAAAVDTFRRAEQYRRGDSDHVFPGLGKGKTLSDGTLRKMMRDLGRNETVHGFRSTFRDWVADETDVPGEVAEAALAHAVRNPVEAAYRRTDYLEKRRDLMELWGHFCAGDKRRPR